MSRVLAISDLHCPFDHPKYLDFLRRTRDRYKTDTTVCLGDELDFAAISRYPKDPDGLGGGDEFKQGLEHLKPYYKAFPNVKVCTSNHTDRPYKLAFSVGMPNAFVRPLADLLKAPKGWEWQDDYVIDGALYFHGEPYSGKDGALQAAKNESMNVVIGHIHSSPGVTYHAAKYKKIWALNCGWGGDQVAYAFKYAKTSRSKAVLGCGVILDGEPHFIPMEK